MSYYLARVAAYTVGVEVSGMKEKATRIGQGDRPKVYVRLPSRPAISVTCPNCWTAQRADRFVCYRCGAVFVYEDEMGREETQTA